MIDFSAIEAEIAGLVNIPEIVFKSREIGRIREVVPITQMPSLDVEATGHRLTEGNISSPYTVPVVMVIHRQGVDRTANAAEFKELVERICQALEARRSGTAYDVIRNIASDVSSGVTGEGRMVRTVVITLDVLAHERR